MKKTTSKTRMAKYAAVVLALVAVLVFCLASCGNASPTGAEYVTGSASKTEYNQGETFDCTGAQIKVTYDNGAVETKDVTKEMVGTAPLTLGTTTVSVTYSENGATVIVNIPVTVKDPYTADKAAAVEAINNNTKVSENATDKGVAALVQNYTAQINAASDKATIDLLAGKFVTELDTYLAEKADILAQLDAAFVEASVPGEDGLYLYDQFLLQVQSAKEVAVAGIKAASSIKEANALLESFKATVSNALREQEIYEGNDEQDGMIVNKIDILKEINYYTSKTEYYMALLVLAEYELDEDKYNELDAGYKHALDRLEWWYEYVTLAINLQGVLDDILDEIEPLIKTEAVDNIADMLAKGVTVLPPSLTETDEDGNPVDVTGDLLDAIQTEIQNSIDEYGPTMTVALLLGYGKYNDIDLTEVVSIKVIDLDGDGDVDADDAWKGSIEVKYDELCAKQTAAEAVINAIDAIETAAPADKYQAIEDAWVALEAWGEFDPATDPADDFATLAVAVKDTIMGENIYEITYEDIYKGHYSVTLVNGKWETEGKWSETIDEETTYTFTEGYVYEYFVTNIDELLNATQAKIDALTDVADTIKAIGKVLLSNDADVDKGEEISAAEAALATFKATYGDVVYDAKFGANASADNTETEATVTAARQAYTSLQNLAETANDLIDALPAEATGIVYKDGIDGGKLKAAYSAYLAFATANTDDTVDPKVIYTDVITKEAHLLACMDQYVALAFAETKTVYVSDTIHAAQSERVGNGEDKTGNIDLDETAFRQAVVECADGCIAEIAVIAYDEAGLTNFNYYEILENNKTVLKDKAKTAADAILAATNIGELPCDIEA